MPQPQQQLRDRTKAFAFRVMRFFRSLTTAPDIQVIGRQLLRSGTSVAANYHVALRGRSRQEFAAKIGIVREEADESLFWLELLRDSGLVKPETLESLLQEAKELTAIFTTSCETAKRKAGQVKDGAASGEGFLPYRLRFKAYRFQ